MSRSILLKVSSIVLLFVAVLCGICAYLVYQDPTLVSEEGGNVIIIGCAILSGILAVLLWLISRKSDPSKSKKLKLR